ncbi:MAG TPA: YaiO family outer membrane beta-barrel protein [Burkholderiaceae bacterium]|nr:YaiO family outer membrane beta-barrel protein [Burkholderiaceae bacterium]
MKTSILALALLGAACGAAAQAPAAWQLELGTARESLTRGLPDWTQTDIAVRRALAPRTTVELNARRTERFGLRDSEWGLAAALPLAPGWSASLGATASDTHRVLPRASALAGLQRELGDGWVAGASLRHTRYSADRANALALEAERYFGSAAAGEWRVAAQLTAARLAGVGGTQSLRVQVDRYFGPRSRVGLLASTGREIDHLGQGRALVSDAQTVVLLGRWAVDADWSLTGELGSTRLADRYRRSGGRLGVQLDF